MFSHACSPTSMGNLSRWYYGVLDFGSSTETLWPKIGMHWDWLPTACTSLCYVNRMIFTHNSWYVSLFNLQSYFMPGVSAFSIGSSSSFGGGLVFQTSFWFSSLMDFQLVRLATLACVAARRHPPRGPGYRQGDGGRADQWLLFWCTLAQSHAMAVPPKKIIH